MILNEFEFLNGLFSLIFAVITTFIGLFIASRYRKYKQITLLYVGFAFPGLASPWYPSSVSFLMILFTGQGLSKELYFFIGNAFIPIFLFLWILAMTKLIFNKMKKGIIFAYFIIGVIFEIYFIFCLITNPSMIGELHGSIDVEYCGYTQYYLIFVIISIVTTAIWFGIKAIKTEQPENKMKGKFQIIAILSWAIAAAADAFVTLTIATLLLIRIVLIISVFLLYIGWILPDSIKKYLIKNYKK